MSRAILSVMTGLLLATTAHADDLRVITGEAAYRERIALPDNAELTVEATGFQNMILAESRTPTRGRQVPLPFEVTIPSGVAATLQAAITIDDTVRWVSAPVAIAPGTENVDLGTVGLTGYTPSSFQSTFICGGLQLKAGFQDDEAIIETDDGRTYHLKPAISADGAKYQSDDERSMFWSKGDEALVRLDGEELDDCLLVPEPAQRNWSARGNEPGWLAVIEDEQLVLSMNYGDNNLDLHLPEPEIVNSAYRYSFPQFALTFSVADRLCVDDMSGQPFPQTVTLATATAVLDGCGGSTLDLLTGPQWTVDTLDDETLSHTEGQAELAFSDDGQISGSTGCNRFFGSFALDNEGGIKVTPLATTQMACSEALMEQEARFTEALSAINGFGFSPEGALLLTSDGETVISASR